MRLAAAFVGAAIVAIAGAQPCAACSCVPVDVRDALRRADAAFVGVLLKKEPKQPPGRIGSSSGTTVNTFRVEDSVKGRFPSTVAVEAAESGASCGIEVEVGERAGLLLDRRDGMWKSDLCSQLTPAELRAAARPLPRPDGRGAAAMVVGGGFGEARTIALDSRGRTLAYGLGAGDTAGLAACPGGRAVAELVVGGIWSPTGRAHVRLAIRSLPRLRRIRYVSVPQRLLNLQKQQVLAFRCGDAKGGEVVVLARRTIEGVPNATTLFRARGRSFTMLYKGFARSGAIGSRAAYLGEGPGGRSLVRFDLRSGARRLVATIPAETDYLTLRADGRYLAGANLVRGRIVRVRLANGGVRTTRVPVQDHGGTLAWTPRGRLLFLPGPIGDGHVFDDSLRRIARVRNWGGSFAAVRGGTIYGISFNGAVGGGPLPRGPVRFLRQLPGRQVYAVAATP